MTETEKTLIDRRTLLGIGGGAALGALAGFFGGRRLVGTAKTWTLQIQGGYGYLFKKDATVLAMSRGPSSCATYYDHKMTLVVAQGLLDDPNSSPYPPTTQNYLHTWVLEGPTVFTGGVPGGGVTQGLKSDWKGLGEPFAPANPADPGDWDDQVWLTERQTAVKDVEKLAARSILVPSGAMSVSPPMNVFGLIGRWQFAFTSGTQWKALSDVVSFTNPLTGPITLETTVGGSRAKIVLKPKGTTLRVSIRHKAILDLDAYQQNEPLRHISMLYEFAGMDCTKVVVPTYQIRTGYNPPPQPSPGDLCPPLMLDEMP